LKQKNRGKLKGAELDELKFIVSDDPMP
jgi:hypothetical protein